MNELGYHKDIAQVWLHSIAKFRSHVWYNYRRILLLFEDFTINGKLYAQIVYRDAPNTFTLIPDWCKPELSKFLSFKVQEGKSPSTLCLYLSSCIRFCIFLNKKGITEYSQITVDTLKEFNLTDRHMTPEGKNAYNTRIRKFLAYLGDCGLLKNPVMYLALPGVYAPKEEVVITLNTDEIKEIYDYNASASSPLELRRSVMLLMGLCMGMRETDIVNLKLSDINWKNASVHFIQQKTKVELELPLLIDVGNALYRYLTKGRPETESEYVFVNTRTPHQNISRNTCRDAINSALSERNVPGSGFHVTRKSFATEMLNQGQGIFIISDALGHRGTDSVHKYLALDSQRMKMCPLSLNDLGIQMKGGM
jgi:site-specific recombinase XerD